MRTLSVSSSYEIKIAERFEQGKSDYEDGNLESAVQHFTYVRDRDIGDSYRPLACYELAKIYMRLGQLEKAEWELKTAVTAISEEFLPKSIKEFQKELAKEIEAQPKVITEPAPYESAVAAAGGVDIGEPGFIDSMRKRAEQGIIEDSWETLSKNAKALLEPRTRLILGKSICDSIVSSHFGGWPYAEDGDEWPKCLKCDTDLEFIVQINTADGAHNKNPVLGLIVLFVCNDENCLVDSDAEGFELSNGTYEIRNYTGPLQSKYTTIKSGIAKPLAELKIAEKTELSEPIWEVVRDRAPRVFRDIEALFPPYPRGLFFELTGYAHPDIDGHYIGGYPYFHNAEELFRCENCGKILDLVVQIASEPPYCSWLDAGEAYIYFCPCRLNVFKLSIQTT